MVFNLIIHTDNAAFEDAPRFELAKMLRDVARKVEGGEDIRDYTTVFDVNGNDVGRFALKDEVVS